jgi:hypothetical protein
MTLCEFLIKLISVWYYMNSDKTNFKKWWFPGTQWSLAIAYWQYDGINREFREIWWKKRSAKYQKQNKKREIEIIGHF